MTKTTAIHDAQAVATVSPDAYTLLMVADLADYAADAKTSLAAYLDPKQPAWQKRVLQWLDACMARETTTFSSTALRTVIADLVTWRNSRSTFRLEESGVPGDYVAIVAGDLGGAAVLGHLVTRLVELLQRHDADMMLEIARLALDVNRDQVAAIGKLIAAR